MNEVKFHLVHPIIFTFLSSNMVSEWSNPLFLLFSYLLLDTQETMLWI